MWQLELLSRVIPAFGALAKDLTEDENQDDDLGRDARDCYADLVSIGMAVYMSCGEWSLGLDDTDVSKLLTALESRFPKSVFPLMPAVGFLSPKSRDAVSPAHLPGRQKFPRLDALAVLIESFGWDNFSECWDMINQPLEKRTQYLKLLGRDVFLFHKAERRDDSKRHKFLKRVKRAAKHMLDVYCKELSSQDTEGFSLSQHPSHGIKGFADRLYNCLDRHWRCDCSRRPRRLNGSREARLSLIRHRQLAPKTEKPVYSNRPQYPAKFEIVLPVCSDHAEWKVTNVMVNDVCLPDATRVKSDVCQYLLSSSETLHVDFLLENENFWYLRPNPLEDIGHYTIMEPLHQFLGNGIEASYISNCSPKEQLILCYVLANSMLYLYPSSWLKTGWNSKVVHFVRKFGTSACPALTFPYISVELPDVHVHPPKLPPHPIQQYHIHPAILELGIIFLEVVTGDRFKRAQEPTVWQQRNKDGFQALQILNALEKKDTYDGRRYISSGLSKAIRACLKLEPPANLPSNKLAEEGPIRHYILSCIVAPLAYELQNGYKVNLDSLHKSCCPESYEEDIWDPDSFKVYPRYSADLPITKPVFTGNTAMKTPFTQGMYGAEYSNSNSPFLGHDHDREYNDSWGSL